MEEKKNDNLRKEAQQYQKIQFIGLCLSTTPGNLKSIEGTSDDGRYLGLTDPDKDIETRINIVKDFFRVALDKINSDKEGETLLIFVLPEFFFGELLGHISVRRTKRPLNSLLINLDH